MLLKSDEIFNERLSYVKIQYLGVSELSNSDM